MNNKEYFQQTKIIEHYSGSKLYGTDTPQSDTDITGIFVPTYNELLGLKSCNQIDVSVESKDKSTNKNTKEAIDCKYDSLQHFCSLAIDGSPNVIERLFVPEDKIIFCSQFGADLLCERTSFVSKKIIPRFLGYATSQKHKMVIRTENYQALHSFNDYLNNFESRQLLIEIKNDPNHILFGSFKGDTFACGDLQINRTSLIKDAKRIVSERLEKSSNRKDLILKHGFDTKFASHLIRLLYECIELLETGELIFPLRLANDIKDIKVGNVKINDVLELSTKLEDKIRSLGNTSKIKDAPDFNKINDLVVRITYEKNCIE